MKFTQGPWKVSDSYKSYQIPIIAADNYPCGTANGETYEEANANAALIAAAPDLLDALEQSLMALIGYQHQNEITKAAQNSARAAIAKARGES